MMPTVEAWLSTVPAWIATNSLRAELLSGDALVLFIGSDLIFRRARNSSGSSIFAPFPSRRESGMKNLRAVVTHPCGIVRQGTVQLSEQPLKDVVVPLQAPRNRLPQFIVFSWDLPGNGPVPWQASWLDIGAGVPAEPPQ
jgi:hypothetical protein